MIIKTGGFICSICGRFIGKMENILIRNMEKILQGKKENLENKRGEILVRHLEALQN